MAAVVQLRYDRGSSLGEHARKYNISERTARRAQQFGAEVFARLQERKLDMLEVYLRGGPAARCDGAEPPPAARLQFAVSSMSFDETSESLALPIAISRDSGVAQRSSWHCLVSRQSFDFGVADGGRLRVGQMNVVRPVVPLIATSAGALMNGLFRLRSNQRLSSFETFLESACQNSPLARGAEVEEDGRTGRRVRRVRQESQCEKG